MKNYYEGNPTMECPKGCKATCLLDCYIEIHQALVGDDSKQHKFKELYSRDAHYHCCGKPIEVLSSGSMYCTVCGNEYKG